MQKSNRKKPVEGDEPEYLPDVVKRVLAVSLGGIGDTVLFSPVIKALKKKYPEASIDLLLASQLAQQGFMRAKEIDKTFVINTNHSFFPLKVSELLLFAISSCLRRRYDIGVYATGLNPWISVVMRVFAGIKTNIHAPNYPTCESDLACSIYLAHIFDSKIDKEDVFIPVTDESRREAETVCAEHRIAWNDPKILAVYPSINLPHRPRWPLSNLIKVIQCLRRNGYDGQVVVIGSHLEGQEWECAHGNEVIDANLAGKMSILASAALLEKCCLALCNDGGIIHIAGAVGCPLVAIMTNVPSSHCPPGENTIMIHPRIPCAPCYPNIPKDCPDLLCLEDISVDIVYTACLKLLYEKG